MGKRGPAPTYTPEERAERKRQQIRDGARRARFRARAYLFEYKRTHPCVDCSEDDPRCLGFDHRDRAGKRFDLSDAASRGITNIERLAAEIAKCDVRCHNCHAKKTIENQEYIALADWERETSAVEGKPWAPAPTDPRQADLEQWLAAPADWELE